MENFNSYNQMQFWRFIGHLKNLDLIDNREGGYFSSRIIVNPGQKSAFIDYINYGYYHSNGGCYILYPPDKLQENSEDNKKIPSGLYTDKHPEYPQSKWMFDGTSLIVHVNFFEENFEIKIIP